MSAPSTPPGWYPDPSGRPGSRYWDGQKWWEPGHYPTLNGPPQRRSNTGLIIGGVIAAVLLLFGGCAALVVSAGHDLSSGHRSAPAADSPGLNEPASDGKFTFTVTKVETMRAIGTNEPRGKWVVVSINVRNTAAVEQTFLVDDQKLIGSNGAAYKADWLAASPINDENTLMLRLGPDFSAEYKLPFDLPTSVEPEAIELHDSAFSGGVTVKLAQ